MSYAQDSQKDQESFVTLSSVGGRHWKHRWFNLFPCCSFVFLFFIIMGGNRKIFTFLELNRRK